ncbi:MAG: NfeD family protein [Tissierellia bacterium]|nr:NfeD family protein [Tissierellia bacterium]
MIEILSTSIGLSAIFIIAVAFLVSMIFTKEKTLYGILSAILFVIFFIINIKIGSADLMVVFLFAIGVLLMAIEVFVPGFGIIGSVGIILIVFSVYNAFESSFAAIITLLLSFVAIIGMVYIFLRLGYSANIFDRAILKTSLNTQEGYNSKKRHDDLIGKEAISVTVLRPSGKIKIDDKIYDAITEGVYVPKNEIVEVVSTKNSEIIVKIKE